MKNLLNSRIATWCALAVIVVVIILTFHMRVQWWAFIDIFFAFMMAFSHLAALYLGKMLGRAAKTLDKCAVVFGICFIVSFIAEYIAMQ